MKLAGQMCALGLDGTRLLTVEDPAEVIALRGIAAEADRTLDARDRAQATKIVNALAEALK